MSLCLVVEVAGCRRTQALKHAFADADALVRLHPAFGLAVEAGSSAHQPLRVSAAARPMLLAPPRAPAALRPGALPPAAAGKRPEQKPRRASAERRIQAARRQLNAASSAAIAQETSRLDDERLRGRREVLERRAPRLREMEVTSSLLEARLKSRLAARGEEDALKKRIEVLGIERKRLQTEEGAELDAVDGTFKERLRAFASARAAADDRELARLGAAVRQRGRAAETERRDRSAFAVAEVPSATSAAPAVTAAPAVAPVGAAVAGGPAAASRQALYQALYQALRKETAALADVLARRHGLRLSTERGERGRLPDATPRVAHWLREYWAGTG